MARKIYDGKIDKGTDWGGDASTGGLPVSGRRVQEFLKESLETAAAAAAAAKQQAADVEKRIGDIDTILDDINGEAI